MRRYLDHLELVQRLDPRLDLAAFRCLVAEALDECFRLLYLLLLLHVGFLYLPDLLLAPHEVSGVVAAVAGEIPVEELIDFIDHVIEEALVMGNDHQASVEGPEVFLEPDKRLDIQVVRGLIEEEEVRILKKDACKGDAHLIAARELAGRTRKVCFPESKSEEYCLNPWLALIVAGA